MSALSAVRHCEPVGPWLRLAAGKRKRGGSPSDGAAFRPDTPDMPSIFGVLLPPGVVVSTGSQTPVVHTLDAHVPRCADLMLWSLPTGLLRCTKFMKLACDPCSKRAYVDNADCARGRFIHDPLGGPRTVAS